MTKHLVALAGIVCLATAFLAGADDPNKQDWQTYVDGTYKVVLRCPADWKPDPAYGDAPYLGLNRRGAFFVLDVVGGESDTAQQLCKSEAEHVVQPYGKNPTIRSMKVQGQSACLVWPSPDQAPDKEAVLTVKYPEPVEISGDRYSFLSLNASKDDIMALTRSLKFLSPDSENAPFLMEITPVREASQTNATTWKAGSPVFITLIVKNNSDRVLHFPFGDPISDYSFHVSNVRWGRTAVTGKYQELEREHKSASVAARREITLASHKSYRSKLEISSLYQLQNPGKYTIQAQMNMPAELGKGVVRSNTLTVTIVNEAGEHPSH